MTRSERSQPMFSEVEACGFADRFFRRQRQEILATIDSLAAGRRARGYGITLAAAAVLMIALSAGLVASDPSGSALIGDGPLFTLELDDPSLDHVASDPLIIYGSWPLRTLEGSRGEPDPLPPIDLEDLESDSPAEGDWFFAATSQPG